jgi:hypothetical protein
MTVARAADIGVTLGFLVILTVCLTSVFWLRWLL